MYRKYTSFEYDANKSQSNWLKHGIDFEEAQRLWQGMVAQVGPSGVDEPRWLVIGRIDVTYWTAIITMRGAVIRIISVRKSRIKEIRFYEKTND